MLSTSDAFTRRLHEYMQNVLNMGEGELWRTLLALSISGQHVRPSLLCHLTDLDPIPDGVIRDAAAIELLHTSTLIHDDIIDGASLRRGIPTIQTLFDDRATGEAVALLAGNLVKDAAIGVATERSRHLINQASIDINLGQLWETESREQPFLSLRDSLRISLYKAGRIFRCIVKIAGHYNGSDRLFGRVRSIAVAAELVALTYQAVDDWLDTVNVEMQTKKSSGLDEANNVHSFMRAKWSLTYNDPNDQFVLARKGEPTDAIELALEMLRGLHVPYGTLEETTPTASGKLLANWCKDVECFVTHHREIDDHSASVLVNLLQANAARISLVAAS